MSTRSWSDSRSRTRHLAWGYAKSQAETSRCRTVDRTSARDNASRVASGREVWRRQSTWSCEQATSRVSRSPAWSRTGGKEPVQPPGRVKSLRLSPRSSSSSVMLDVAARAEKRCRVVDMVSSLKRKDSFRRRRRRKRSEQRATARGLMPRSCLSRIRVVVCPACATATWLSLSKSPLWFIAVGTAEAFVEKGHWASPGDWCCASVDGGLYTAIPGRSDLSPGSTVPPMTGMIFDGDDARRLRWCSTLDLRTRSSINHDWRYR
mmetsp:Transcript_5557/g.16396  ORF Transcript_5557/g.16396 Transcript_5557/m.16396 type:complete len:263 (-) Transcript_5557:1025-1813(-)